MKCNEPGCKKGTCPPSLFFCAEHEEARINRIEAGLAAASKRIEEIRLACAKDTPFEADGYQCVRCGSYNWCVADYEQAFGHL